MQFCANPYLCTGVKGQSSDPNTWSELPEDLQDKILRRAGTCFVYRCRSERRVPEELWPRQAHRDWRPVWAETLQQIVIERSRQSILGHGPGDTLSVRFSDCVDRHWWGFSRPGRRFNKDAVCAAMDQGKTWRGVCKIRLRGSDVFCFELVRQDAAGRERSKVIESVHIDSVAEKEALARRLVEELHLRRRVVAGCDEFTVG